MARMGGTPRQREFGNGKAAAAAALCGPSRPRQPGPSTPPSPRGPVPRARADSDASLLDAAGPTRARASGRQRSVACSLGGAKSFRSLGCSVADSDTGGLRVHGPSSASAAEAARDPWRCRRLGGASGTGRIGQGASLREAAESLKTIRAHWTGRLIGRVFWCPAAVCRRYQSWVSRKRWAPRYFLRSLSPAPS